MATYAVSLIYGLEMTYGCVTVEAANSDHAMALSLGRVDHDDMYDFLYVTCVAGEPGEPDEEGLTAFWDHHHNFIGPIDDIPF